MRRQRRGERRTDGSLEPSKASARLRSLPIVAILLGSAALGVAAVVTRAPVVPEERVVHRPIQVPDDGFVSSKSCKACHPSQYDTWYGSFHRTMTQVATPDTVQADFDAVRIEDVHGTPMLLTRQGDEFWAAFDDPGWEGPRLERPRITRQVVMITGSHHQQIYWYATQHDRALNVLPGVYVIAERRWVPRSAVVLHPPNQSVAMMNGHWNAVCIACHTTAPKTQFDTPFRSQPIDEQSVETTAAEFGISCEACHGPGQIHVDANQNPLRRYQLYLSDQPDPTIVQPALLDPRRSSQVCGQCHSVWEFYDSAGERQANATGFPYRPGDELRDTRFMPQPMEDMGSPVLQDFIGRDPEFMTGSFWPDGMIRVSGREYNGLIDSPCFRDATEAERTLSCFSCHTMHKTPEDSRSIVSWAETHQVSDGMDDNGGCVQCHQPLEANLTTHTRHDADSTGSTCYNCHMPYTSYGLLKAVRSHTISSPSVTETVELGRPNACNLCHLDQTLGWTGEHLSEWYGAPPPELSEEEQTVAAALLWVMKGDAGERALAAWNLGWQPAQEASGTSWMVPHLAELAQRPVRGRPVNRVSLLTAHTWLCRLRVRLPRGSGPAGRYRCSDASGLAQQRAGTAAPRPPIACRCGRRLESGRGSSTLRPA